MVATVLSVVACFLNQGSEQVAGETEPNILLCFYKWKYEPMNVLLFSVLLCQVSNSFKI